MKTLILIILFFSSNSFAQIGNFYQVDQDAQVYRGKEPKSLVHELLEYGISDVIIFKNQVRNEVSEELASLERLGISSHHIPFQWKDYTDYELACEQVLGALEIIRTVKDQGGKVFFHCTAGEDRTGALAGLYQILEGQMSMKQAFKKEMCQRHYSDGNPNKPRMVTSAIEKGLTPLFVTLAEKLEQGDWAPGDNIKKLCRGIMPLKTQLRCSNQ